MIVIQEAPVRKIDEFVLKGIEIEGKQRLTWLELGSCDRGFGRSCSNTRDCPLSERILYQKGLMNKDS